MNGLSSMTRTTQAVKTDGATVPGRLAELARTFRGRRLQAGPGATDGLDATGAVMSQSRIPIAATSAPAKVP